MAKCGDKKNPLQRSGTAQSERLLPGLQKGYANVDEKKFADWIVFAKAFASHLNYYELNGAVNGDWSVFFSNDVSSVLGTIAIQDVDAYKRGIKERLDFLKNEHNVFQLAAAKIKLNDLFSAMISMAVALDELYRLLPDDVTLKINLENLVKNHLAPAMKRLLGYYKAAKDFGYLNTGDFDNWKVFGSEVIDIALVVDGSGLCNQWLIQPKAPEIPFTSWKAYFISITKDESIFGNDVLDIYFNSLYEPNTDYNLTDWLHFRKMNHAANHNLFASVFDQFLSAYSKLVKDSEKDLLISLESRNTHPAHYALFLAFLKLFHFVQNDINGITRRHLDFYYKEILQLKQRPALPNSAHIIAELAKPVDKFILDDKTLMKAGKDSEGKELVYGLRGEQTFNKAKVASLRSVFFGDKEDDIINPVSLAKVINEGRLFAAPMINSDDGIDKELTSANKEWHPMANRVFTDGKISEIKMPKAEIGFAVASHYLYLQEGEREVWLVMNTSDTLTETNKVVLKPENFSFFITTEKGWFKITKQLQVTTDGDLEFSFLLSGDEPAISNYNPKIHGGTFNVNEPVVKILLQNNDQSGYIYKQLKGISITNFEVWVYIGAEDDGFGQKGIKQLQVITDAGPVDTSKPFQPFGGQPKKDSTLVIGNREIFTKKNAALKLNIEWADMPALNDIKYDSPVLSSVPDVSGRFLKEGKWSDKTDEGLLNSNMNSITAFSNGNLFSSLYYAIPPKSIANFNDNYLSYNAASVNGFMQLVLNDSFGHKEYLNAYSVYLIDKANDKSPTLPEEPYTPKIKSIYVSYMANTDAIDVTNKTEQVYNQKQASLFHLYPFGDAEQHLFLSKTESDVFLFPQFKHQEKDSQGEFYIGFQHLAVQQSVNVLFQVMDGTANPRTTKPGKHIQWSFLSDNRWIDFLPQQISDSTMQLIQSGIIRFVIPAKATLNNTLLPAGLLWIKATVENKVDAVCKLISVDAQAAVADFADAKNAADFLNEALPANSISKLKNPQAAIKKITQPYASFGGRPTESADAFYVRVSERLRHKSRAITIWDYEHLVLEAFPMIHKVKCLNHTVSKDEDYNEVLPGHVTIITIPNLSLRNAIDPLKPFTSIGMLDSIAAFLRSKISCHVQLHVVNPVFEAVKLKFELQLAKGFDDFTVYSQKLREEITAFLSPWAYSNTAEINFGGKVYKSVLINFIEERPYVDYITKVEMAHLAEDGTTLIKADNDEIVASTAKSILVSVPAVRHLIEPAKDKVIQEQFECAMIEQQKKK